MGRPQDYGKFLSGYGKWFTNAAGMAGTWYQNDHYQNDHYQNDST